MCEDQVEFVMKQNSRNSWYESEMVDCGASADTCENWENRVLSRTQSQLFFAFQQVLY